MSNPAIIEYKNLRFVVTDSLRDSHIQEQVDMLCKLKVACVVRASDLTYSTEALESVGIKGFDFSFDDGKSPPVDLIKKWIAFVNSCFVSNDASTNISTLLQPGERVCVHCVAGLGRAPVLVALAFIEIGGMEPLEAVQYVRDRRKAAFNAEQVRWFESYTPISAKKQFRLSSLCCIF